MRKTKKGEGILDDIMGAIIGGSVCDNVPTIRRPITGSPEEKERMAKIRAMRKIKGKGILQDIAHGLFYTGLPIAGTMVGDYVGGQIGGIAGEKIGSIAANKIGKTTGYGIKKHKLHTPYSQIVDGVPYPIHGGSFLQLGG